MAKVTKEKVVKALKSVYDPEIPMLSVVDLGLIYDVEVKEGGEVDIKMTLTAPGCPLAHVLPGMIREAVKKVEGVKEVKVEVVWDPPWTPERMSKEARRLLGLE